MPTDEVTWDELRQRAEASWPLETRSRGGTALYRYGGRLYVVGYGESSSLPGGAEQVLEVRPDNLPGFAPLMEGGHAAGMILMRVTQGDYVQTPDRPAPEIGCDHVLTYVEARFRSSTVRRDTSSIHQQKLP